MKIDRHVVKGLAVIFIIAVTMVAFLYSIEPKSSKPLTWVHEYDLIPGNKSMGALLDKIHTEMESVNKKRRHPQTIKRLIRKFIKSPSEQVQIINFLLSEGKWDEAISKAKEVLSKLEKNSDQYVETIELMAISYLRKGEEENCVVGHNANSCLMPIKDNGIYQFQGNTRQAIALYEKLLSIKPQNWLYRWLLNLAYQTIGEYPEDVPKQWLIQSELLEDRNQEDNFINIGPALGLIDLSRAGGAVMDDFNNDGYLDLMYSDMYRGTLKLYINNGDQGFTDNTFKAGLSGQIGIFNLVQFDYNNDGYLDVFGVRGAWRSILGMHPNSLLRNNGDNTFTDVTVESGILSFKPTSTAVCADFNGDGWTDIFVGNESNPKGNFPFPCEFYLNNGDGSFTEVSSEANLKLSAIIKGLAAGDYNNDGLVDLFVSRYRGENYLFKNNGPNELGIPQFENVSNVTGVAQPELGFTSWFWDYNNDGNLDLFVSEFQYGKGKSAEEAAKFYGKVDFSEVNAGFYHNNGDGTFTNHLSIVGLDMPLNAMGANFGDTNNDGWLDFYIGTGEPDYMGVHPNRLLLSKQGNSFVDITSEKGVGHIQKGHGIAFGDIDNDGDQDILAEMGGTALGDPYQNALFQNPGNDNNWITLKLIGTSSSRDAIGTKIRLVVNTSGIRKQIFRTVSSGGSFGANSLQLEIGIGKASKIDTLVVNWQNNKKAMVFTDVLVNQFYEIIEDSGLEVSNRNELVFDLKEVRKHHR